MVVHVYNVSEKKEIKILTIAIILAEEKKKKSFMALDPTFVQPIQFFFYLENKKNYIVAKYLMDIFGMEGG